MTAYELNLPQFAGPLDKLLELIEDRKMEVTQISLAQVTDDFITYLKTLTHEHADLRIVADFISVASKLVFIKSKFLLPDIDFTPEEESAAHELESRVRLYQEMKPLIAGMLNLWKVSAKAWGRPFLLDKGPSLLPRDARVFYPGKDLNIEILLGALAKMFESFKNISLETKTLEEAIVTLEEKIQEVIKRIEEAGSSTFKNLSNSKSRIEAITIFLAILHLAREQRIYLEQSEHLSDIIITSPPPMPPALA